MVMGWWFIACLLASLVAGLIYGCSVHVGAPTGEYVAIRDSDDAMFRI